MPDRLTGTVKMINREKMYGFLRRADGAGDVFFHRSGLAYGAWDRLAEGVSLTFEIEDSTRGPRATRLQFA